MREELKKIEGQRGEFSATFERFGRKTQTLPAFGRFHRGRTVEVTTLLFRDVRDATGKQVTDHLWFTSCKQWLNLGLKPGDRVKFEARVNPYVKGYAGRGEDFEGGSGRETDYKLAFPTKARVVSAQPAALPLFAGLVCRGCGQGLEAGQELCDKCEGKID